MTTTIIVKLGPIMSHDVHYIGLFPDAGICFGLNNTALPHTVSHDMIN